MFIVFLTLTEQKTRAPEFMAAHSAWIKNGVATGEFLVVGSLQEDRGGCIIVNLRDRAALEARLQQDPFVTEHIVNTEIHEITPSAWHEKLNDVFS